MKVTAIAAAPPAAMKENPAATPELLASSLARYSRSNKGIDSILSRVDWDYPDASVERIFRFIDYGHASIGGLTGGIAICVDDCSMFLAYKIFEIAQLVDGQESSTRYITMNPDNLCTPQELGIGPEYHDRWRRLMKKAFELYQAEYERLDTLATENPAAARIPADLPEKVRTRMLKNYALDRCRYFIPLATKTSAAYIMTARVWADTLKRLEALPLKEAQNAATLIRRELEKAAPRLIRHSYADAAARAQAEKELHDSAAMIAETGVPTANIPDEVFCSLTEDFPSFLPEDTDFSAAFAGKENRYSQTGHAIRRRTARFAWNNIALAELRDLNRHRSGHRYTPFTPTGFYLPAAVERTEEIDQFLREYAALTKDMSVEKTHWYTYLLGTQVAFEHTTQLDKLIYEIELRTGLGAHFRYAEHLRRVYELLIQKKPALKDFITPGQAEPE
ncbi:MAG: FAD-dependent thymidylate synthase [Fibrobacterota bacterium]